jgi:hypothetical protein
MPISQIYARRVKWTGSSSPPKYGIYCLVRTPGSFNDYHAALLECSVLAFNFCYSKRGVLVPH